MIKVADGIYRGPRLDTQAQWEELISAGVKTIINLEMGYFDFFHGKVNEEVQEHAALGITVIHLQLGDIFAPRGIDLHAIVWLVKYGLQRGSVYVHCLHGVDRTGLAIAMVRRYICGWSQEEAIKEMFDQGFHKFPYLLFGWVKRLKECL